MATEREFQVMQLARAGQHTSCWRLLGRLWQGALSAVYGGGGGDSRVCGACVLACWPLPV